MAQRRTGTTRYYDPITGQYVSRTRRRKRRRTVGALGSIGTFGQTSSLKATLGGVKGVVITGAIATTGAIVTDRVYEKIGASLGLVGWQREAAKIATGIALGILIAKLLKKPKLAAAFAIGPVVVGLLNLFGDVMGSTAGLGLTAFTPASRYDSMYGPMYGVGGVNVFDTVGAGNYPASVPPPPRQKFNAAIV